jgi:photosystem II stability/assembly factor-like uncharacterized protein
MKVVFAAILMGGLFVGCGEQESSERWEVLDLGTRAEFRDIFFIDEQRGWIVGGGHNIDGGIFGATEDGGLTWRFQSGIVRPLGPATSVHLNGVWFLDERNGFIVGSGFRIMRTLDGGAHWHKLAPARGGSAHLLKVQFVDEQFGWAIGSGGLVRTVDGGATWEAPRAAQEEAEPARQTRGRAVHFLDRNRGWLVGSAGLIRSTNDGGVTWTTNDGPPSTGRPDLWGLDFADGRYGWAVGERGTIMHTADGGDTWRPQVSGVVDILMDVDFLDASRGWVVGFERQTGTSSVLQTTDGGNTWTEQARVPSEATRALFVLDERHAWAVGSQQRRGSDDGSQKLLRYEVPVPTP